MALRHFVHRRHRRVVLAVRQLETGAHRRIALPVEVVGEQREGFVVL